MHRPEDLHTETSEARFAVDEDGARDGRQLARHHDGAADRGGWHTRGARHSFEQHGFEGALPKLTEEQPDEEVLLVIGGSLQQLAKHPHAVGE